VDLKMTLSKKLLIRDIKRLFRITTKYLKATNKRMRDVISISSGLLARSSFSTKATGFIIVLSWL
jgi:hypothetical protein